MVGVVEGFRWALLGTGRSPALSLAVSTAAAVVVFIGGVAYFQRTQVAFADVV